MEQILVAAICLLTGVAATVVTRHRARAVTLRPER
jgi:hypothetical protein